MIAGLSQLEELTGQYHSRDATWPSSARGIAAAEPGWLETENLVDTKEINGFTIFDFEGSIARARLFDCGGYDRSKGEDGGVQSVSEILISG